MKTRKLYYFAPIVGAKFGEKWKCGFVGAASGKVLALTKGLRSVGVDASVVSCPIITNMIGGWASTKEQVDEGGVPVFYNSSVRFRVFNRICAAISYPLFAFSKLKKGDVVVFYNYFPEYIPAAIACKLLGVRCILDIEDAPLFSVANSRELIARFSLLFMRPLCDAKTLVASRSIAKMLKIDKFHVVHGSVSDSPMNERGQHRFSNLPITFMLGGTLQRETGLHVFCEAITSFLTQHNDSSHKIKFVFTGIGGDHEIHSLIEASHVSGGDIADCRGASRDDYIKILNDADVVLSLKLPESHFGGATFPSKVIEIAASGALLISTNLEDVASIFDSDSAVILNDNSAAELCDLFCKILKDPRKYASIANTGRERIRKRFAGRTIAKGLLMFIDGNGAQP